MKISRNFLIYYCAGVAAATVAVVWLIARSHLDGEPASEPKRTTVQLKAAEEFQCEWGYRGGVVSLNSFGKEDVFAHHKYDASLSPEDRFELPTDYDAHLEFFAIVVVPTCIKLTYGERKIAEMGGPGVVLKQAIDRFGPPTSSRDGQATWTLPEIDRQITCEWNSLAFTVTAELLSRSQRIKDERQRIADEEERKRKNPGF